MSTQSLALNFLRIGTRKWFDEHRGKKGKEAESLILLTVLAQRIVLGFGLVVLGGILASFASRLGASSSLQGFLIIIPIVLGLCAEVLRFWWNPIKSMERQNLNREKNET